MRKTPASRSKIDRSSAFQANPGLWGNPDYEAAEAARCNETHAQAVAKVAYLSNLFRVMWRKGAPMVDHRTIILTLQAKRIPFVLTGMHGISCWLGRSRATHDVDVLVKGGRNYGRAVKAMKALYPELEFRDFSGVGSFFAPGEKHSLIDVTYPHRADIEVTLATAIWVEDEDLRYRIPRLEAAIANKYGAMLTPTRPETKRVTDAVDFTTMVLHSLDEGRESLDLDRLRELGEKVWPGGGGEEILRLVEQAKAGEVPRPA